MIPRSYCREALSEAEDIYPHTDIPDDDAPPANGPEDYGFAKGATANGRSNSHDAGETGKAFAFPLTAFENIKLDTDKRGYLVKGLLPSSGLAVIWGPPKCYKTFWTTDLGLHIALGWKYRDRRVQQATVVYIGLEGRNGIPARIKAFKQHHSIDAAPFYLLTTPLDLAKQADALIGSIETQLGDGKPGVVFIDTLNCSLVGSKSKDEDMARYLAAAGKIEERFGCLVVIVHHCGIDASRPRGHTSLSGAVEVQLKVQRTGDHGMVVTVELAKDFAEGAEILSRLESVEVGTDPDGDPIASLVVLPTDAVQAPRARLKGAVKVAFDALVEAINEAGELETGSHSPGRTRTCAVDAWRRYSFAKTIAESDKADTKQKAFVRASKRLQELGIIGVWNDRVWIADMAGHAPTN